MKTIKIDTYSVKEVIGEIQVGYTNHLDIDNEENITIKDDNLYVLISDVYINIKATELGKAIAESISDIIGIKISVETGDNNISYYNIPYSCKDYEFTINYNSGEITIYKLHKKIVRTTIEK